MNIKAKHMMEKWHKRVERNYKIAEKYHLTWKETGEEEYHSKYLEYKYRGQICGQASADFEECM